MRWFEKLMSTNKGRLSWLGIMVLISLFSLSGLDSLIGLIVIFLAWLAIYHLARKINVKHKKTWQISAILFSALTYIVFLIVKRKQLAELRNSAEPVLSETLRT